MFRLWKSGGMGIRTPDLLIANETLYQLSYTPFWTGTNEYREPKWALCRNPSSGTYYALVKIRGKQINVVLRRIIRQKPGRKLRNFRMTWNRSTAADQVAGKRTLAFRHLTKRGLKGFRLCRERPSPGRRAHYHAGPPSPAPLFRPGWLGRPSRNRASAP